MVDLILMNIDSLKKFKYIEINKITGYFVGVYISKNIAYFIQRIVLNKMF